MKHESSVSSLFLKSQLKQLKPGRLKLRVRQENELLGIQGPAKSPHSSQKSGHDGTQRPPPSNITLSSLLSICLYALRHFANQVPRLASPCDIPIARGGGGCHF